MDPKTLTLIIAAVTIAADAGATIAGLLPPAWALVVGALVSGLVAIDRALHNVAQGVSLKSYLTSPSAWAAALVIVASIISAVAGVVPVTYAAGIAVFAGMVLRVARVLQGALQPVGGQMLAATPGGLGTGAIPSTAAQQSGKVVSLPPAPRSSSAGPVGKDRPGNDYGQRGSVGLVQLLILAVIAAAMATLLALPARAQTPAPSPVSPQLGGCFDNGLFCAGLAAQASVTKVGLSSGNKGITGGFSTGVGYGLTLAQDKWYASGIDLFINVNSSSSQLSTLPQASNSRVSPMLMLNLLNYLFVGFGADVTAPSDPAGSYSTGWYMTFGFGSTLNTITAGYAKQEAARQVAAEKAKAEGK